jgi:ribosomal protein S2
LPQDTDQTGNMRRKNQAEKKKMKKESETRLRQLRRNSGFHRGGSRKERTDAMVSYVDSRQDGKVRRDRKQSRNQIGKVLNRAKERRKTGENVRVVGTKEELGRGRESRKNYLEEDRVEKKGKRLWRTRSWVSGRLTNVKNQSRKGQLELGRREKREGGSESSGLPGLIVFRHPQDHGVGRKEARRCGIPTAGIADSDCKYVERLTYPIPGNDESRYGQRRLGRWLGLRQNSQEVEREREFRTKGKEEGVQNEVSDRRNSLKERTNRG